MFKIEITTWVNGDPTVVRTIVNIQTKEEGKEKLRSIGRSWDYNVDYAAYLLNADGEKVAQLNIWKNIFQVVDLQTRERGS